MEHNHDTDDLMFKHAPKQRRLIAEEESNAKKFMQLKANKKLLQQDIIENAGKIVTLRNLSNVAAKGLGTAPNGLKLHQTILY